MPLSCHCHDSSLSCSLCSTSHGVRVFSYCPTKNKPFPPLILYLTCPHLASWMSENAERLTRFRLRGNAARICRHRPQAWQRRNLLCVHSKSVRDCRKGKVPLPAKGIAQEGHVPAQTMLTDTAMPRIGEVQADDSGVHGCIPRFPFPTGSSIPSRQGICP